MCTISALPELLGTGSGIQSAHRYPVFTHSASFPKVKSRSTHASYRNSIQNPTKMRTNIKGHQVNSAKRDAQAIASILGEPLIPRVAQHSYHHACGVPVVGDYVQVASVKPGAALGEGKTPVASPGSKTPNISEPTSGTLLGPLCVR